MQLVKSLRICLMRFVLVVSIFSIYSPIYAQKKTTFDVNLPSRKDFDLIKNQSFIFLKKENGSIEPRKISSTRIERDFIPSLLEIKVRDSLKKVESLSFESNSIIGIDRNGKNISANMLSTGGILSVKNKAGAVTRLEIISIKEIRKNSSKKRYVVCTTEFSESEVAAFASLMADSIQDGNFSPDASGVTNLRNRLYAPNLGRFISPDPIHSLGFGLDEEGLLPPPELVNLKYPSRFHPYAYASNDPVNIVDPLGLSDSNFSLGSLTTGVAGVGTMAAANSPAWSQVFQRGLTIAQALQMNAQASYSMIAPRVAQTVQGVGQWITVQYARGPGQILFRNETAALRAQQYQEQISGMIFKFVYRLNGVHFDGFRDGRLLDAKGPGYAAFFRPDLTPQPWFRASAQGIVDAAQRQIAAANGIPIDWHVAEQHTANALRLLLQQNNINGINIIHTLPR